MSIPEPKQWNGDPTEPWPSVDDEQPPRLCPKCGGDLDDGGPSGGHVGRFCEDHPLWGVEPDDLWADEPDEPCGS